MTSPERSFIEVKRLCTVRAAWPVAIRTVSMECHSRANIGARLGTLVSRNQLIANTELRTAAAIIIGAEDLLPRLKPFIGIE